jgi:hypothetical protein
LAIAQRAPQSLFGFGRVAAHVGGAVLQFIEPPGGEAPTPTPPLKGRGAKALRVILRSEISQRFPPS